METEKAGKERFFISFEGIDGCGKTVMSERLADFLREAGCPALWTREPGGSSLGVKLRRALLGGDSGEQESMDARTEALLFAADRSHHVAEVIIPALERGEVVVCDRFTDSTLAYQGGGRGMDVTELEQINSFASRGLQPDLTFYLNVPLDIAFGRRSRNSDRMENEGRAFFERVAAFYDGLARENPGRIAVIDASLDRNRVWEQILDMLKKRLPACFLPEGGL